jgi:hypothetical protein
VIIICVNRKTVNSYINRARPNQGILVVKKKQDSAEKGLKNKEIKDNNSIKENRKKEDKKKDKNKGFKDRLFNKKI